MEKVKSYNDYVMYKEKGDYFIYDDLSDILLVTIHTYNWSCTKEEKEEYLDKIFKACL